MGVGPIKPSEIRAAKRASIPDEVFAAFNEAIARSWDGHQAIVRQDEVTEAIVRAMHIPRDELFRRHLLDVEEAYRADGWDVKYDKPGYNETYHPATYTFTIRRGGSE